MTARTVRTALLSLALAAAVAGSAGCGEGVTAGSAGEGAGAGSSRPAGPGSSAPGSAAPAVHRLGPRDSGRTVTMAVGDRLLVAVSTNRTASRWALSGYPRGVLAPELAAAPAGGFGFVARAAGSGSVLLTRAGCGPSGDRTCVAGGAGSPASAVTWTVKVVVR